MQTKIKIILFCRFGLAWALNWIIYKFITWLSWRLNYIQLINNNIRLNIKHLLSYSIIDSSSCCRILPSLLNNELWMGGQIVTSRIAQRSPLTSFSVKRNREQAWKRSQDCKKLQHWVEYAIHPRQDKGIK